jgi:hypothetical protein
MGDVTRGRHSSPLEWNVTVWRREGGKLMATYTADIDWKLADGEDFPKRPLQPRSYVDL